MWVWLVVFVFMLLIVLALLWRYPTSISGGNDKIKVLILGCSLDKKSKSQLMAKHAENDLKGLDADVKYIDMRKVDVPLFNGENMQNTEPVKSITKYIKEANAVIFATPIYNFNTNAVAKNIIEHTGQHWKNKVVGFMCAAAGTRSYMSPMSLSVSLILDERCLIVPRFVYATRGDFKKGAITSPEIKKRIKKLCGDVVRLAEVY